ncbi:MAG TPA: hypothetical protein VL979_10390 [Solirubrobacteraceae bacterium]|nr:hypothetical protein [Solirubrobacteraceae bacterium]
MRSVAHRAQLPPSATLLLAALASALALAGCGKSGSQRYGGAGETQALATAPAHGALGVDTRNTTRLGGAGAVADAASVAHAVYPGLTAATRPSVAVLVDQRRWQVALAASVLASSPVDAPILYSDDGRTPASSEAALASMHPLGAPALGGAQVIRIGTTAPLPHGYLAHQLTARAPAAAAAAIASLLVKLDAGSAPRQAIVLSQAASPAMAMPAASLAAESGAPILLVSPGGVPAATAAALARMRRPTMYLVDAAAVSRRTLHALRRLGAVRTIPSGGGEHSTLAEAAVQNSIEVARYTDGAFGWGVKEPGHGLVFANAARPLDAPAAALLAATADYGPLLLLSRATGVPAALASYLADIQPAYSDPQFPAVRGAYNHGWLIGDESAISAVTQAEIDSMLQIVARTQASEEPEVE